MTNESGASPGWYADPMRRYEHRYFNGRDWTSDVSIDGVRLVDQLGLTPTPASVGGSAPQGGRGVATASMILGIIAVTIAWMPLLVVLGVVGAILAIVLGIVGLRRSRTTGAGRSAAVAGLATGASALVVSVIGVLLTVIVLTAYDEYLDPASSEITITECRLEGTRALMTGRLENTDSRTGDYSILVGFVRPGTDNADRTERIEIDGVEPGDTVEFEAGRQVDLDEIDCIVLDVNGPLPFGVALD